MNPELKQYVADAIADYAGETSSDIADDGVPAQIAEIALKAFADWAMKAFGIAVGPQGEMGYPSPQGSTGIAHIVVVDRDGHRMMTREEYERTFGSMDNIR